MHVAIKAMVCSASYSQKVEVQKQLVEVQKQDLELLQYKLDVVDKRKTNCQDEELLKKY